MSLATRKQSSTPFLNIAAGAGAERGRNAAARKATANNSAPATHPKTQRFQTVTLVTQTVLFYNVGVRQEARCAKKLKLKQN